MSQDMHVINQRLREFTVGICTADKAIIGTGIVVSDSGQIATCAHVVHNAIDGASHPRDYIRQTINIYFPQARREEEKRREAQIVGCLPDHDDDIALLELTRGLSPVEPGRYARIGSAVVLRTTDVPQTRVHSSTRDAPQHLTFGGGCGLRHGAR